MTTDTGTDQPNQETRDLAAAIAEVLDVPLPATCTPTTVEQHRQVLHNRAYAVQRAMEWLAGGRYDWTLAKAAKHIREADREYPVVYAVDASAEGKAS